MKLKRAIKRLQKTNAFNVSVTYDTVTPESAEHGDFNESGFEIEPFYTRSINEIIDLIRSNYVYENFHSGQNYQSIYSDSYTIDYYTGEDKRVAVHISGPDKLMRVLNNAISKQLNRSK